MKVALLGKVPKGDKVRDGFADWQQEYIEGISGKVPEAKFLHGDLISDKEGSEKVVGHDLWLIKQADVVIVDARQKIGAGTAQEMVIAKYFKKPLVAVIPKNTHHRRNNVIFDGVNVKDWIHPFLDVSSDYIAESIHDAAKWIKQFSEGSVGRHIKDISVYENSINAFEAELPKLLDKYRQCGW